tara:strand:+ start:23 stop:886 length:864 start_codon:yes stop_codon:yes gene_type:complete
MKLQINKLKSGIKNFLTGRNSIEKVKLARIFRKQICDITYDNKNGPSNLDWGIFSQFNEDGLINEACRRLFTFDNNLNKKAIEFGSGGYSSNIGLLSATFNLECKMIDGSKSQLSKIRELLNTSLRYIPQARQNIKFIHKLLNDLEIEKEIKEFLEGVIPTVASVDIDSFDELIIKELMRVGIPVIIAEYNACFGPKIKKSFYTRNTSHNMKKINNKKVPIIGISYSKLLELSSSQNYFCWQVEKSGVNMILINKKYSDLFSDRKDSYKKNIIYDYIFSDSELKTLN